MKKYLSGYMVAIALFSFGLTGTEGQLSVPSKFDNDVEFLKKYGNVIVLKGHGGKSRVAVMPTLQARVMTSTTGSPWNLSYGWINRPLFESGEISPHKNAFGGEERFWLGPEGGQFSIFFAPDSAFTRENWYTPRLIDLDPWDVASQTEQSAVFTKEATLTNYSNTTFQIKLNREIRILDDRTALETLGVPYDDRLTSVSYQSINDVKNTDEKAWDKETGLLMIWLLGRFNPSPDVTIVVPYVRGSAEKLGPVVNGDYSNKVPADRLKLGGDVLFFRGDGDYRSKIGLTAARAKGVMGSYDASNRTLTIIKYTTGIAGDVYVNQKWEIQKLPYSDGDVVNAYNAGPSASGEKPASPFYELETSSPARALKPGERLQYIQTTSHFQGDDQALDALAKGALGVSLDRITAAFHE